MAKETYVIISYVPMLRGQAGDFISASTTSDAVRDNLLKKVDEAIESDAGHIEGCIWGISGGEVHPILIMHQMNAVLDHLIEWSEGVPQEWFNLHIHEHADRYSIALLPKLEHSIERFRAAMMINRNIKVPRDTNFQLMFKPLMFISTKNPVNFNQAKGRLPKKPMVTFIDTDDFKPGDDFSKIDDSILRELGRFKINWDSFNGYLSSQMEEDS